MINRLSASWLLVLSLLASVLFTSGVVGDEPAMHWWKGNLHTHSLWSDGDDFPEMIADWYREHGYHFLALSDHNILSEGQKWIKEAEIVKRGGKDALAKYRARFGSQWVETRGEAATAAGPGTLEARLKPLSEFRALVEERGRFLMIPSEEISDRAEGVPVHLNATNIQELILPLGGKTVREAIEANVRAVEDQAKRKGREILVHLNHPNFGLAITAEDMAEVLSERFFEVYNGHPGVKQLGDATHAKVELLWDIANTIRLANLKAPPLYGIACDDSHDYHGEQGARPGRGWVMVQARYLTPEHIIRGLKAARFYASSGVTIRETAFDPATGKLEIAIEGEEGLEYTTDFIGTPVDHDRTVKPAVVKPAVIKPAVIKPAVVKPAVEKPAAEPAADLKIKPARATKRYSADVGKTFATVKGLNPSYTLSGKELYVRAVVTSSRPHPDPSYKDQREQAWTQPVGWERWLAKAPAGASGQESNPVGAQGKVGNRTAPTTVDRLEIDKPGIYENYRVDGRWGMGNRVKITADNVTLRDCEIFNCAGNGVGVFGKNTLIENCRIHHCLRGTFQEQQDAHGITGRWNNVTIRNCEIFRVSGDAVQFDPDRKSTGNVLIENCTFWTSPLEEDAAGFNKGERPGENGIDTKTPADGERCLMTVRNCYFHGWKQPGQVSNLAALNLKENVLAKVEHCVLRDNEIAFRLRGPGKRGGANVQIKDCAVYDAAVGVRVEDKAENLKIDGLGFGRGVARKYHVLGTTPGAGYENRGEHEAPAPESLLKRGFASPRPK